MRNQELNEDPLRVALMIGSVREGRVGKLVGGWAARRVGETDGLSVDLVDLAEVNLPMGGAQPGGGGKSPIAGRLAAADAYVVVTPEYNHSFPAALKNAIDWHYREWMFKPVSFVAYGAASGGVRAIEQLRLVFGELSTVTVRNSVTISVRREHIQENQFAPGTEADRAAQKMLHELAWWAKALRTARLDQPYRG